MMTTVLKRAALALAAGTMLLGTVRAGEATLPFDVELGVDLFSHYVWRGMVLTDDPVIQPSLTISKETSAGTFAFNIWGSVDMTDFNELGDGTYRLQELDYTLSYAVSPVEGIDFEAGVIYYTFPGTPWPSTWEAYASVAFPVVGFVTPSITAYYDFDEVDGWYLSAALEREFELTEQMALTLSAALGFGDKDYNDAYWGVDKSALNDLSFGAALSYQVTENFSVGLSAGYMVLVNSDIRDAADDKSKFFMGVSAGFAF